VRIHPPGSAETAEQGENGYSKTFRVDPDRVQQMLDVLAPLYRKHPVLRSRGVEICPDAVQLLRDLVQRGDGAVDDAVPEVVLRRRDRPVAGLGPNDARAGDSDDDLVGDGAVNNEDDDDIEDDIEVGVTDLRIDAVDDDRAAREALHPREDPLVRPALDQSLTSRSPHRRSARTSARLAPRSARTT
jgi:hypothetical protein